VFTARYGLNVYVVQINIIETESVYWAVRTESLCGPD
jgi:hypothetical protein